MAWRGLEILRLLEGGGKITRDLVDALGMTKAGVRDACKRLAARGLLERYQGVYCITPAGREALVGGSEVLTGPRKGSCAERYKNSLRARAWRGLRIRRKVCLDDLLPLVQAAGATKEAERKTRQNLSNYLHALTEAGYLALLPRRGGPLRWLLTRDTGPCAPAWHKAGRTVTDANTGEVYPLRPVGEEAEHHV
ncbi:MAG: hypothetical protein AUJ49_01570 [Desulfovibrionaceae bacterium CG1_02_65_16]|nr:MAG: hypothetical protein AUJ49_01570 [Desulfovibrionaceae bacterium CG1_02_65_16]